MVHIHHRKKTSGGCIDRLARSGSGRESVRGVVGTMNAARSRPDWLATVQSGRKQAQSRVCTPGFSAAGNGFVMIISKSETSILYHVNKYFVEPGKLHLYYTMQ